MEQIATYLDKRCKHLGISQARLAELTGVSLSTVQRFFAGQASNISFDTVRRMAEALGTHLEIREAKPESAFLQEKAMEKAHRLTSIVQGTSALEAQGLTVTSSAAVTNGLYIELLSGPKSKIWSST